MTINNSFIKKVLSKSVHWFIDVLSAFNQDPLNNDHRQLNREPQPQEASYISEYAKVIPQTFLSTWIKNSLNLTLFEQTKYACTAIWH